MSKEKETPEELKAREEKEKIQKENRDRFIDAATRRVQKAIIIIESMQQFTSPNYAYKPSDVEVIQKALTDKITETTNVLLNPKVKKQITLFS